MLPKQQRNVFRIRHFIDYHFNDFYRVQICHCLIGISTRQADKAGTSIILLLSLAMSDKGAWLGADSPCVIPPILNKYVISDNIYWSTKGLVKHEWS